MFDVVKEIADAYFASEEYEDYSRKNNTKGDADELRRDLIQILGKGAEEEISSSLSTAHNLGEYNGIIQGIGIGLRLIHEYA